MYPDTQDEEAAPLIHPPAAGAINEAYIMAKTVLCTPAGHIYTAPVKILHLNPARDPSAFDRFSGQVGWDTFDNFDDLTRKKWMRIHFQGDAAIRDIVYKSLLESCDIVGIGVAVGNCTAFIRRGC